jgi:hypothetical protein
VQSVRKSSLIAASIGALILGGGVLATVAFGATGHGKSRAGTHASRSATTTGAFTSNEDPAHEAGESAAVEAAENSGQRPHGAHGGAFRPNEDPAHEAGESAAREAEEDAGRTPTTP